MTKFKIVIASIFLLLGTMGISQQANAQSLEFTGPSCYCDQTLSGCWHDGDSGQKCSSKKECAGGKCKPKGGTF